MLIGAYRTTYTVAPEVELGARVRVREWHLGAAKL